MDQTTIDRESDPVMRKVGDGNKTPDPATKRSRVEVFALHPQQADVADRLLECVAICGSYDPPIEVPRFFSPGSVTLVALCAQRLVGFIHVQRRLEIEPLALDSTHAAAGKAARDLMVTAENLLRLQGEAEYFFSVNTRWKNFKGLAQRHGAEALSSTLRYYRKLLNGNNHHGQR